MKVVLPCANIYLKWTFTSLNVILKVNVTFVVLFGINACKELFGSVLSSAYWIILCKWSWLTLVTDIIYWQSIIFRILYKLEKVRQKVVVFICINHFTICTFHIGPLAFFDDVFPRATLYCTDLKFHPLRLLFPWQGNLLSGGFWSQVWWARGSWAGIHCKRD